MDTLLFGTAGIPLSTQPRDTLNGIAQVRKLGLSAMELEFVHSVNISREKAPEVKKKAVDESVILTCHGEYFINLNAQEPAKLEMSRKRILRDAERAWECGAWSITFHPGFYMKQYAMQVHNKIENEIKALARQLHENGNRIWLRPETMGKPTQYGSLDELLKLSEGTENIMPCIDFCHLHARTQDTNTIEEWRTVFQKVERQLGKHGLENLHVHMSGVKYSSKGELSHLPLDESDLNYKDLVNVWKEFKVKGIIISESPNIEKDALLLQKSYLG